MYKDNHSIDTNTRLHSLLQNLSFDPMNQKEHEKISLRQITDQAVGKNDSTKPATWAQGASAKLAAWILLGVLLIVSLAVIYSLIKTPSLAEVERLLRQSDPKVDFQKVVEAYQTISDSVFNRLMKFLQYLVGTIALPLITLLLGYAFGKQNADT